jgi:hypothetical protein
VAFGVVLGIVYALTGPKRRYYPTRWRNPYQMSWSMPLIIIAYESGLVSARSR